ncbi:MAG: hypothetical protein GC154_20200 [bacterium]|nr:hypothetical protein [bacterium]
MLGIGTGELIVLMGVALMVFGPHKLPELARYLAQATKMFQDASREIQRQLDQAEREIRDAERKKKALEHKPADSDGAAAVTAADHDPYQFEYGGETQADQPSDPAEPGVMETAAETEESYTVPEKTNGGARHDNPMNDPVKADDANRLSREMSD